MRALLFSLLIAVTARAEEITVFAAASLTDVLENAAADYERATGDRIVFSFAASSTLARQIEQGAPADLFASADEAKMDALAARNLIDPSTRIHLFSNTLVIVSNRSIAKPQDLARVRSIALAEPSSVPAGIYAKQYLTKIGIWGQVERKIVPTDNVRGALAAVKSGNVDAAIVYKSDTRDYAYEITDGPKIAYSFAVIRGAKHAAAARRFLEFLKRNAANWQPATSNQQPWSILFFTIRVAALATLAILPPALAIAWLLARKRWRGKSIVETLVAMPLVMPPVATGLILLQLFGRRGPIGSRLPFDVVFTWRAVVLAMAVMSFPLLVRAARLAFATVDPRLEQIARTLGARDARVFVTITLPLAARGIIAGMLLAFARALGEFGATILVAGNIPGRTSTLSLSIYNLVQLGRDAEAMHLLIYAVVIAFGAVWVAEAVSRRVV